MGEGLPEKSLEFSCMGMLPAAAFLFHRKVFYETKSSAGIALRQKGKHAAEAAREESYAYQVCQMRKNI